MSTPPSNPPRASQDIAPPPYPEQPQHTLCQPSQKSQKKQQPPSNDLPYVQELLNTAHPSTYTLADPEPADTSPKSKKSMWQKLKEENEERKAKNKHVTHEQAARMVGHDEEWQKEREMGSGGKNGWMRDPVREDRWWGGTVGGQLRGDP